MPFNAETPVLCNSLLEKRKALWKYALEEFQISTLIWGHFCSRTLEDSLLSVRNIAFQKGSIYCIKHIIFLYIHYQSFNNFIRVYGLYDEIDKI
jgi:hypothetical protein